MNCEERCQLEVDELHHFFEQWFKGELPDTDEAFARLASVMAEEFEIISPVGKVMKRDDILDAVRAGHGRQEARQAEHGIAAHHRKHSQQSAMAPRP